MQSALTSVSLDQWMEKLTTWKTATRELVRLWLVNDLGCQRDLANHLGLSDRAIRKHVAKLREDGDLPPLDASDGRGRNHHQKQELSSYSSPVPISSYPSAVMPEEVEEEEPTLDLPTAEELMARVLNLEAENTALREQLKAAHSLELVSDEKRNDTVLAEHYVHTQEHGSCDSYKDAQYHLSCFMDLLSSRSGSHADGWTEAESHGLSVDLSAAAKMCANASGSYQERLDAEVAEWKAKQTFDEEGAVRIHNASGESFDRLEALIQDIKALHRELFEGGLSEGQWQDLSQQYQSLQYFADIRWANRRKEMEQRREKFDGMLEDAKARYELSVQPDASPTLPANQLTIDV